MLTYFPYSAIINTVSNFKSCISRHPYFGEWSVNNDLESTLIGSTATSTAITEIYY